MSWARTEAYSPREGAPQLAQRLHNDGLVYAANRLVFHRVGLALGVAGNGTIDRFLVTGLSLHSSDDPDGIEYAEDGQHERGLKKLATAADLAGGPARWSAYREVLGLVQGANEGDAALKAKLDEMTLHDQTGDLHDEGYMAAITELRAWMAER